ncbi:sporulation protein YabP [Edaphobacillus lindanitolerans]|uniref:Sporulation protein YabP n=1 Tax=Edaphobacillus lindanitolerans TaxID=550447 RepID=A0A1U7PQW6_9BACI|nr:sporulation protein YabP [Edaphobacillus lindanitolerans]SIT93351.1 sporulation protein YabP [Edaphobacillus lindanitolerans]
MQFQQTDNPSPTYAIPSGDHVVTMRNRKRMDLTSVKTIDRFDQEEFLVRTSQGQLQIRGEELRIVHLDVDKGLLTLEGNVKTLHYDDEDGHSRNILTKLFG